MKNTRGATHVIVERLIAYEARHVFAVADKSHLDVMDALYDARGNLQVVTCRHEAAAANMAHRDKSMTQIDQPSRAPMTILRRNS
jgi:acetolactate synthase I/II/III large subunit